VSTPTGQQMIIAEVPVIVGSKGDRQQAGADADRKQKARPPGLGADIGGT
jgi:hypothetical protein